jgi:hypothetical protein
MISDLRIPVLAASAIIGRSHDRLPSINNFNSVGEITNTAWRYLLPLYFVGRIEGLMRDAVSLEQNFGAQICGRTR